MKKVIIIIIMCLLLITVSYAYESNSSDLLNSLNQINKSIDNNNYELTKNLEEINNSILSNNNQMNQTNNYLNSIISKLNETDYSSIFHTIAGVLGSLLAILFAITSIFISNIKDKFGITLTDIKKNEKILYFALTIGILFNLFHFLLTNYFKFGTIIFIIFDIIYLIIMFGIIWKHFELVTKAGNLEDALEIKYKEIKKLNDDAKIKKISELYGLIDYSINNNIKYYSLGMNKLSEVIESINNHKLQRELFSDFADLIIKAPRRYSREVLKLYVNIANKLKTKIIKQIEENNSEFIHWGSNLHFVTVRVKELSKELINKDVNMDRSVLSYALLTDINKANIEVIKKQNSAFYLCNSSITWALELINRFIQNSKRLEHNDLELIFLNLYIYFDQIKGLLTINELETDVKNNIKLLISEYEKYADKILNKPTPIMQDVWKKQIIRNNIHHFSPIEDDDIDSEIFRLHSKYN